jgi:hypothetical protein
MLDNWRGLRWKCVSGSGVGIDGRWGAEWSGVEETRASVREWTGLEEMDLPGEFWGRFEFGFCVACC